MIIDAQDLKIRQIDAENTVGMNIINAIGHMKRMIIAVDMQSTSKDLMVDAKIIEIKYKYKKN